MLKLLTVLCLVLLGGLAQAQERLVRTKGLGAPAAGQAAITARQLAIDDAMRQAVEQGIGVFITSDTKVQNFELISDEILKKASGFARIDKIIAEGPTTGGTYLVEADVVVSSQKVLSKLRDLILNINDPTIAVYITETLDNRALSSTSASTAITKSLLEFGFRVLDPKTFEQQASREQLIAIQQGNAAAIVAVAQKIKFNFIVVGTAKATRVTSTVNNVISARALLELKMIDATSGAIIWTDEVDASDFDFTLDTAVAKTMRRVAGVFTVLEGKFMNQLRNLINGGGTLKYIVKISNLPSFSALNAILQKIRTQSGVKSAISRAFDTGMTEVEVEYNGPIDGLALLLEKCDLVVTGFSGFEIRAKPK